MYTHEDIEQEILLSVSYSYDLNYYKHWRDSVKHYFRFSLVKIIANTH